MTRPDDETGLQVPLARLSRLPSAYTEDVVFSDTRGVVELRCTYEHLGSMYSGGFRFERVRAYRFRADGHCTLWHIDEAYDTLVEVKPSAWVEELQATASAEARGRWTIRHFMIYVDDHGAYEVAAESYEQLPETPAS